MARKKPSFVPGEAGICAKQVERLIRERGDYDHVFVRPYGSHLIVESRDEQGALPIARLTYLGGDQFEFAFHRHTGRWEPMPFMGSLQAVTDDLIDTLISSPQVEGAGCFKLKIGGMCPRFEIFNFTVPYKLI